jgi:phthiocerol/phenolphthiocerol synthesis type-I polyketide synthase C
MDEDPIAIIGAACRLPGSKNLDEFWEVLASGRDVVTEIPDERWTKAFYFHPNHAARGKSYTWAAGIIENVAQFDAGFFGISPRESEQIDPQQRILLELAWEALEDSGIPASRLAGEDVGVFVGAAARDYGDIRMDDPSSGDAYFMTGVTNSIVANRISYVFDLHGPSFTVDTACSSSLVALDLACKAIREQRAPMALVGGVSLLLSPFPFIGFCRASMLSPDGRCFAFDARANGYVRAEGAAMIVLKPLSKALEDGDSIRGVLLGTGTNSDGRTVGLSLPNARAQAALLRSVYDTAGISPDALSFVEAHGTGTQAGDPVELSALGQSLGQHRRSPLLVGSVKTNIGHLEAASGMAGLLKTMLALQHREIPASLHFNTPNPNIPFSELNIEVVGKASSLPAGPERLIAGVNSFGFGGANAHAILASPPPRSRPEASDMLAGLPPLLISARSEAALTALARTWSTTLAEAEPDKAAPLLRAAARCRDQHRLRLVARGDSPFEIAEKLDAFAMSGQTGSVVSGSAIHDGKLAFVFSGNGVQKPGMARDALTHSSGFRDALRALDAVLAPRLGWSALDRLATESDPGVLARTDVAQPLLFAVQVGITVALREAGIEPSGCIGHSVGEIAAAWATGALSLTDACKIIVARSTQQQRSQGMGGMAALGVSAEEAAGVLAALDGGLEIAAINSRRAVTIAGPGEALDRLEREAAAKGWIYKRLDLDYAFHSAALDPIEDELIDSLSDISPRDAERRMFSTVTGDDVCGHSLDGRYWWRNVREPVRFENAINFMIADGYRIFVEIGPGPALMSYIRDGLKAADVSGRVIGSLNHRGGEHDPFPAIAAECHVAGADISASTAFDGPQDRSGLPSYPWQRQRHWFHATVESKSLSNPLQDHPLLGFRQGAGSRIWRNLIGAETHPWLADHRVDGVAIMPAAALLEIALAAALRTVGEAPSLEVSGFEIPRAMVVEADREMMVSLGSDNAIEIKSRPRLSDEPWTIHAVGRVAAGGKGISAVGEPRPASVMIGGAEIYATAQRLGLDYGPVFRTVASVDVAQGREAAVALLPSLAGTIGADFLLNPALLDGAMQAVLAMTAGRVDLAQGEGFLPSRFGRLRVFAPFGRMPSAARVRLERVGNRSVIASMTLYDDHGANASGPIAEIEDCAFQRVQLTRREPIISRVLRFDYPAAPRPEDDRSPVIDVQELLNEAATSKTGRDYSGTALLFDAFLAAVAYDAIAAVAGADQPFSIQDLIASGKINATATSLLCDLLSTLESHAAAFQEGRSWHLAANFDLPDADVIWRTILLEAPELAGELALIGGADLKSMLRRGCGDALLPTALVEQMLYNSASGRLASDTLRNAVRALAAQWPRGRPLRILEIGAGSGFLTRRLLDGLADWPGALTYVASDPSGEPPIRVASETSRVTFAAAQWNCQKDGEFPAGKLGKGRFDLIVSMYALTRGRIGESGIGQLHKALAPGGLLISVEPEPNGVWRSIFRSSGAAGTSGGAESARSSLGSARAELLAQAGFTAAAAISCENLPWPVAFVFGRRTGDNRPRMLLEVDAEQAAETGQPADTMRSGETAVLIAAGGDPLARGIAALLSQKGLSARIIDPPEVADGAELLSALAATGVAHPRILLLPSLGASYGASGATRRMVETLTVARLVADARGRAQLFLVTQNAQPHSDNDGLADPTGAALWGLGRTLANEMPQLDCRMIDLPAQWSTDEAAAVIAAECAEPDNEREIVWSRSGRSVARLRRGLPRSAAAASIALAVDQPGLLESLRWKDAGEIPSPAPGEVAIDVRAAGLNFRDVMWALALLPEEALLDGFSGASLGLECAGVIRAVGEGVTGFAPGDRVMALAPAALRSHVTTPAHAVVHLPERLSFAEGATVPVAYLTTIYALGAQARLEAGEWVLIHGGAGGVGLAAIAYARHRGATIIATAGSETKREFLRRLGVDHVFDSRSLSFADDVRSVTGGMGVDVVLNSLSGEAMERSLGLLRPFGRFVELGKRDFMFDTRVGLRAMRQNISYYAVDIDRLPVARPDLSAGLLVELTDLMANGALYPLPYREFPFADAPEAFRLMQASSHIGKIVLSADDHHVERARRSSLPVRSDRTYLITGGLSGFGLETARWLAERGARHLALLGRRGATTEAESALAQWAVAGVHARAFACDVADPAALENVLNDIRASMPPIAGAVHAAMVVDDGLVEGLTAERIQAVLAPKLDGALNLDRLTRSDDIELFILYSSATTLLGAPGQGSYVAANMAVEAVARRRCAEGLPALAVAWGAIADFGYLARQETARDGLARRLGTIAITAREALDALPVLFSSGEALIAFAPVRFEAASQYLPILATPAFSEIAIAQADAEGSDWRAKLSDMPAAEAKEFIVSVLVEETGRILSLSPSAIDAKRALSEFGMDSLMAVELRLALETRLGIDMPIVTLSDNTSLTSIAVRMVRSLSLAAVAQPEHSSDIQETILRHEATTAPGIGGIPMRHVELTAQEAAE